MAANQLFADWVTGDLITATKLNQMKNDLIPWAQLGQPNGPALLDSAGMVLDGSGVKIIEYGSNANGSYIRFADGTQICWRSVTITVDGLSTGWYKALGVAFPAAFIDNAWRAAATFSGFPVAGSNIGQKLSVENRSPTAFDVVLGFTSTPLSGIQTVDLVVIGRWK